MQRYRNKLITDLEIIAGLTHNTHQVDTLFIGGGTPDIYDAEVLSFIIDEVKKLFGKGITEITIEANPNRKELELPWSDITRVSFGIQSFSQKDNRFIGRYSDDFSMFSEIPEHPDISIDLLAGLPGMIPERNINILKDRDILKRLCHISVYMLSLNGYTTDKIMDMDEFDNKCVEDYVKYMSEFERSGFVHYEISNLAVKGHECRHNLHYWKYHDYLAAGAGASCKINNNHYTFPQLDEFFNTDTEGIIRSLLNRKVPDDEVLLNTIMMRLRTEIGISTKDFNTKYLRDILEILYNRYKGMIKRENDIYRLNRDGMIFYNTIISDLFLLLEERR